MEAGVVSMADAGKRAGRGMGCRRSWALVTAVAATAVAWSSLGRAGTLDVVLDEARIVKLPDRVATIVVGNPAVADISVQPGGIMVLTGRGYGQTNVVVLDRSGRTLLEEEVRVRGPDDNMVVVYRGVDRESYSCAPKCERRFVLGDGTTYFETTGAHIGLRNSVSQTGAPPPKN
jgi:Flp pilus assembly secretin CpaC